MVSDQILQASRMKRHWRHRIANTFFPKHFGLLDQLNWNARIKRWLKDHPQLLVFSDREHFYEYINKEVCKHCSIDYLEFGVYEGESMRSWVALNQHPDSRFFGFDSFSGLPEDWGRCRADRFDVKGRLPLIEDRRISLIPGWFQDTLPRFLATFKPKGRLVINNDSDLYSSTLYCLTKVDPLLSTGSVLIFDEYFSALHEFKALDDYLKAYNRLVRPLALVNDEHGRVIFEMK